MERLKEIAETDFDDVELMAKAVRDTAQAIIEMRERPTAANMEAKKRAQMPAGRVAGKPVESGAKTTICKHCHADVVVFISRRTNKPYLCDMELGEYQNQRTMLTGSNWLHQCREGR